MSQRARDLLKLSVIIVVTFGLGLTLAQAFNIPRAGVAQARVDVRPAATGTLRGFSGTLPSFSEVVDRVNPSVVYITVLSRTTPQSGDRNVPPEFQEFFRRYQQQQPRTRPGSGTGFIVSRDGYILTNNHVVAEAERVTVRLLDNREFTARVIGRDPNTDVAVIKIDADNLPAVSFGNSEQARIGDWVLAFGNPLGFTFTVTSGIVSAKGRQLRGLQDPSEARYQIQDFIQTDAAINPGNSGGPLVNMDGQVIGINSAIASQTGLYSGYGFAIPVNLARRVMDELISHGRVDRAVLGIGITDVQRDDAEAVGLTEIKGIYVGSYSTNDSPARTAGIELGDVIVAVNDTVVDHSSQLQQMVGFRRPGETVRITVVRREGGRTGVRRTFNVRLAAADAPDQTAARTSTTPGEASEMEGRLGLRVETLPAAYIQRARLSEAQQGVLVADVEEGGPSWQRVLGPDEGSPDIILQVNDVRVRTPEDFKRALRAAPAGSVVQLRVLNLSTQPNQEGFPIRAVNVRSR